MSKLERYPTSQSWKDIQHPKAGGAEVVIHRYLAGLVEQGHAVVIFP